MSMCRCGHSRDLHLDGVCVGECQGDVCECARFELRGKRAKPGKSKRQDVLHQWRKSIDAPVGTDPEGATLAVLVGKRDPILSLAQSGEQSGDEVLADYDRRMRERYGRGRQKSGRRNATRDMEIYDRSLAGESTYKLATAFGVSPCRIFAILNDVKAFLFELLKEDWTT